GLMSLSLSGLLPAAAAETNLSPILPMGHAGAVVSMALSADGKRLLTGSEDRSAILWDAATGQKLQTFVGHDGFVSSVVLSADGKHVLTGSTDKTAVLWEADSGKKLQKFIENTGTITSVAISADGTRIATASGANSTATLWDAATGRPFKAI